MSELPARLFLDCSSRRLSFRRRHSRSEGQRTAGFRPDRRRCRSQRGRRLHRQQSHRGAAHRGQGAPARHGRQSARGGHQRGQRQLRRGPGRAGRRARHLRRRGPPVRLPRRRGVSVVDRCHWRAAAGGEADGCAARAGHADGLRCNALSAGRQRHPHHRHGGEDGLRSA